MDFHDDFQLEHEILEQIDKEKEQEEKVRKEKVLWEQEKAWKALEEKRKSLSISPMEIVQSSDPNTLVDLDFESVGNDHGSKSFTTTSTTSPHLFNGTARDADVVVDDDDSIKRWTAMGFDPEIVKIGLDLFDAQDEIKFVDWMTTFMRLEEQPEKFSRHLIKQALLIFDQKFDDCLLFLRESEKLLKRNISNEQIFDALVTFKNDIKMASAHLEAFATLKEMGFSDVKVQEALVMCNNDSEKAIQYLLGNI